MKKIFTLLVLCLAAMAVQAKDITIYVQATTAPFIWVWESGSGGKNLTGGTWPGVQLTEKKTVKDTEFWYMTFSTERTINVIFNDGGPGGAAVKKTADINDINSDRYFTYNGTTSYTDITTQYADLPDAVISFLALTGNHKASGDEYDEFTSLGDNRYQIYIDLTSVIINDGDPLGERWECWIRPNGQGWVNEANGTVVEDPDNVLDHEDTSNSNFVIYLDDANVNCHQFTITATWTPGPSSLEGWKVRIEKGNKTTAINAVRNAADKDVNHIYYNIAGQRVQQPTKGLYIVGGKKVIVK